MNKLGIYVHTPYCIQKCRYCDFTSFAKTPQHDYYENLCGDVDMFAKKYAEDREVDSIYFGGGTPSLVDTAWLLEVLNEIRTKFKVSEDVEISIEANPETLNADKLKEIRLAGFNRISIGVQSFNDYVLKALGRVHDSQKAFDAVSLAKEYFDNVNLDLMFGLPMQNIDIWKQTLDTALSLKPEHISFYSLQLEEGTPLFTEYRNGKVDIPSWDENRDMYHYAVEFLKFNGYTHYEVSNASKPGYECRHNLKYWNMQEYLGIGLSAHSFMDGKRFFKENEKYCNEVGSDSVSYIRDRKGDFIFTKLRLIDGFKLSDYKDMFGVEFKEEYKSVLLELINQGLLGLTPDSKLKFTAKGLDNTNNVIERFLSVL